MFKTALTTEQYNTLRLLYYRTLGLDMSWPEVSAIFEGDSLTEISSVPTFSQLLNRRSHWSGRTHKRNVAKGGENIQQMLAEYEIEVQPYATEPGRRYVFLWAGRNNVGPTVSATNLHAQIKSYWQRARADGFKVVAFTVIPAGPDDANGTTPVRLQLNALIRADQGLEYDHLIDLASLPEFQDPFDLNYFSWDTVHLTAAAHEFIADWINATITEP